jgi:MFS family permease
LIADHFTRAERPRAVARYMLGGPLSLVIGYFLAGWLNELYGWRATFMLLGVPGLGLAAVAWFTLREPRLSVGRRSRDSTEAPAAALSRVDSPDVGFREVENVAPASPSRSTFREVCTTLAANVAFRHLLLCVSVLQFFGYGILQWQPAFFLRSYGLQTGELGSWFALIYGVGGILGTYWGGELASKRAAGNEPLQLNVMALMCVAFGAITALVYLSPNLYLAFASIALSAAGGGMINGPLFATIQTLVPPHQRATSIALIYLFANLIGMGLGPLTAGALSDALQPTLGTESLRYALLALCPGYLWAAWHLLRASRAVAPEVQMMDAR